jgi:Protein of unknown function (DUF3828)
MHGQIFASAHANIEPRFAAFAPRLRIAAQSAMLLLYRSSATISRIMMPTRRILVFTALTALLACSDLSTAYAAPPPASDPVGIVSEIYTRVTRGKGDQGGGFVTDTKAAKAKYLSKPLIALWAKADAATPKDEVGAVDFDPVTNSQDPDVKSFALATEKLDTDKATIAVTMTSHRVERANADDRVVRYDFVHEGDKWKIDDIRGAIDGKPWSIRELLTQYLKDVKKAS